MIFFLIATYVADVAVVNPNGIKTLLANDVNTFSLMVNQLSLMYQEVYQETLLIVQFYRTKFLTIVIKKSAIAPKLFKGGSFL